MSKTFVALNQHGKEVNVMESAVPNLVKKGFIIVAEVIDGQRVELEQAISSNPLARKIFSAGWDEDSPEKVAEVKLKDILDTERTVAKMNVCENVGCGFEAKNAAGLKAHKRSHTN